MQTQLSRGLGLINGGRNVTVLPLRVCVVIDSIYGVVYRSCSKNANESYCSRLDENSGLLVSVYRLFLSVRVSECVQSRSTAASEANKNCTVRYYNYVLQVHSIQWNAGMGNTDTLHPNSCFCSFSIPTSNIF